MREKKSGKKLTGEKKVERGKIEHKICIALTGLREKTVKATAWPSFLLEQLERGQKFHVTGPDKLWTQNARILQRRPYKRPCGRAFLWKKEGKKPKVWSIFPFGRQHDNRKYFQPSSHLVLSPYSDNYLRISQSECVKNTTRGCGLGRGGGVGVEIAGNDIWSCPFSAFHDRPSHPRTVASMRKTGWEQHQKFVRLCRTLAMTFDLAAFRLSMIASVKNSLNHSRTVASMREAGWEQQQQEVHLRWLWQRPLSLPLFGFPWSHQLRNLSIMREL